MYVPLFLCLYESFWKAIEYDQRWLLLSNGCLSAATATFQVSNIVKGVKKEIISQGES